MRAKTNKQKDIIFVLPKCSHLIWQQGQDFDVFREDIKLHQIRNIYGNTLGNVDFLKR